MTAPYATDIGLDQECGQSVDNSGSPARAVSTSIALSICFLGISLEMRPIPAVFPGFGADCSTVPGPSRCSLPTLVDSL